MRPNRGAACRPCQICLCTHVHTTGIRELRSDLAGAVRRATAGDRTIVTAHGRPVAQLAPLDEAAPDIDRLISSGCADPAATNRSVAAAGAGRRVVGCPHRPCPAGAARVTLALDTSALLALAVDGTNGRVVLDALDTDPDVVRLGAGAHRGTPRDRSPHRRADPARRPRGRDPADMGPPARRPDRPALPRSRRQPVARCSRCDSPMRSISPPPNDCPARSPSSPSTRPRSESPSDSGSTW